MKTPKFLESPSATRNEVSVGSIHSSEAAEAEDIDQKISLGDVGIFIE